MPSGGITVTVDTSELIRLLASLRDTEIPTAARNTLRDLARAVATREKLEIQRVVDRPTPYVQNSVRVLKRAETTSLETIVGVENPRIAAALKPSIPGFGSRRNLKAIENRARSLGLMSSGQWLVPSRTMKLDRYGNVSRAVARNMMSDISLSAAGEQGKFVFATKGTTSGIWLSSRIERQKGKALQLLVVGDEPTYTKRFKFHHVGISYANRMLPSIARAAIDEAIRRRRG